MANRDLDAEIVKEIFDWRYIPVSADYNGENKCHILFPKDIEPDQEFYNWLPRIGKIHEGWYAPRFSDDLKIALSLVRQVALPVMAHELPEEAEEIAKLCLNYWKSTAVKRTTKPTI